MNPQANTDYKKLFSGLIKKQMVILGPDITFAKVRNVVGLKADINGDVQSINGDPRLILQELINQFVTLSGEIVKKTMETMVASAPQMAEEPPSSKIEHIVPITASDPAPLHSISVEDPIADKENSSAPTESEDAIATPFAAASQPNSSESPEKMSGSENNSPEGMSGESNSPDQKIDPLVHEVQMPGEAQKKSEPPDFSSSEIDSLNNALKDIDSKANPNPQV